ncbi:MAG: hypothetical protein K5871_01560 [Lachnospiraceae bacterium]|nr:hypothetical protein [Lachnospiraceae bacterium]
MDKEVLFGKTLEELKRKAALQGGFIDKNDILGALKPLELDDVGTGMVFEYLKGRGIRWEIELAKSGIAASEIAADDGVSLSDTEAVMSEFALDETDTDYLKMYLDELEELETVTEGEKRAYTISAMAGDKTAQNKLVESYLKDIAQMARIYTGQGVFIEDLIGEGNAALVRGVGILDSQEKPEDCEGFLMKLAMDSMEELIGEASAEDSKAELVLMKTNKVYDKAMELAESLERKVSVKEVAEYAKISEKAVREAMEISGYRIECIEDEREQ